MKKIHQFDNLLIFLLGASSLFASSYFYYLIDPSFEFGFWGLLLFGVLLGVTCFVILILWMLVMCEWTNGHNRLEVTFVNIMGSIVGYSEKEKRELIKQDRDNYVYYYRLHIPRFSTPFHEFTPKELNKMKRERKKAEREREKSYRVEKARSNNPRTGSNMTFAQGATVG